MKNQYGALSTLKSYGWLDDEEIYASAIGADGAKFVICVSGEIVTLVPADAELDNQSKIFSDSVDRLSNVTVKRGLFKSTLAFEHNGKQYSFRVYASKKFFEYFVLLSSGY